MSIVTVRKSGGANIVTLPKMFTNAMDISEGTCLRAEMENGKIILTPTKAELTLDLLLLNSPPENMALTDEDIEWLEAQLEGSEV